MPIEIRCPKCERKLSVPDKYAGKRVKCPNCQGPIGIPAPDGQAAAETSVPKAPVREMKPAKTAAVAKAPAAEPEGGWYLQTEDGEQYGPVEKKELDAWLADGRIDASCQLLREGWQQWKWAEDVYPQLAQSPTLPEPMPAQQTVVPPLPTPGEPAAQAGPLFPQQAAGRMGAQQAPGYTAPGAAGTANLRRTLADCLRPWLIFIAIALFLGGALGSYGIITELRKLLKIMGRISSVPWQVTVALLLMFVSLAATLVYIAAGFFLVIFQQRMNAFLRREAHRELAAAMRSYRTFWLLMYAATFTLVGVALINMLLEWAS